MADIWTEGTSIAAKNEARCRELLAGEDCPQNECAVCWRDALSLPEKWGRYRRPRGGWQDGPNSRAESSDG